MKPLLNPPAYHILLALGERTMHGYAIMSELERRTDGTISLLPGTLYSTVARMLGDELIREVDPPLYERQGGKRRYYQATSRGREAAAAETARLATLLRLAREDGLIEDDGVGAAESAG